MSAQETGPQGYMIKGVYSPDLGDKEAIRPTFPLLDGDLYFHDPRIGFVPGMVVDRRRLGIFHMLPDSNRVSISDGQVLVEFGGLALAEMRLIGVEAPEAPIQIGRFKYKVFESYEEYERYDAGVAQKALSASHDLIHTTPFGSSSAALKAAERRIFFSPSLDDQTRYLESIVAMIHANPKPGSPAFDVLVTIISFSAMSPVGTINDELARMYKNTAKALHHYELLRADAGEDMGENAQFREFRRALIEELRRVKDELKAKPNPDKIGGNE
jgi:hypothetical protein